jgi:hypothetical protein
VARDESHTARFLRRHLTRDSQAPQAESSGQPALLAT